MVTRCKLCLILYYTNNLRREEVICIVVDRGTYIHEKSIGISG